MARPGHRRPVPPLVYARLGLDSDVIEAARRRLDTGAAAADAAIAKLEQLRTLAEREETAVWGQEQAVRWIGGRDGGCAWLWREQAGIRTGIGIGQGRANCQVYR